MTPLLPQFDWRTHLPALQLPRAVSIALGPTTMLLGTIGLMLMAVPPWLTQQLFDFSPHYEGAVFRFNSNVSSHSLFVEHSIPTGLIAPWASLRQPLSQLLTTGNSWATIAGLWTHLLLALCIWGLIGGAIARLTALRFAKHQRKSVKYALQFSARQFLSYLIGPLLPLAGMGLLAAVGAFSGWLASMVPHVALDIAWGFYLVLGFAMTVLVLVTALGWPLMVAAISTEDSDGFDGLARAYGLLTDRPWYALLLTVGAGALGSVGMYAVQFVLLLTADLAQWTVAAGHGAPIDLNEFWRQMLGLLVLGFGASYFWSAWTVIYLLLRQSDDGTPLSDVADERDQALRHSC